MNFLIKIWFYIQYFILKRGKATDSNVFIMPYIEPCKATFYSKSFTDGQWHDKLPWWDPIKWNTIDYNTYGIFSQCYGKFYFKVKMGKYVKRQPVFPDIWPALWILDIGKHYYEIDIELFEKHFGYTVQFNHNGPQEGATKLRANFYSQRLYRNLQKNFHLFLIDWNKDWIRFSINGILCARFRNEIHIPMQIIISKCSLNKTIIQ